MGETVGAILDRLQSLLGKGYLFAGLFPLLAGILFALPLVWAVDPEAPYSLRAYLALPASRLALYTATLLFLTLFASFLLWVMNSWFRSLLDGTAIPLGRRQFVAAQLRRYFALERRINELQPDVVDFRADGERWTADLRDARERARRRGASGASISDETQDAHQRIVRARDDGETVPAREMRELRDRLLIEFYRNTAEAVPDLRAIHDDFAGLLAYAASRAECELNRSLGEKLARFPATPGLIEPTDLANSALANVDQMYQRYGMNVELFWPLLERFGRGDEKMNAWLEESKLRLDFSVAMTTVCGAYVLAALPVLLVGRAEWWVFLCVAALGPIGARTLYRMCVRNAHGLYATMRAAAELYRFDLLKALHCPLPADSDRERELWTKLTRLGELGEGTIVYQHPA